MQKIFLLVIMLFISVICTACINSFAVQELNNTAKAYMEKGELDKAICRLQSSIELDGNIFNTRYNLGVALIEANRFKEGEEELLKAQNLDPEYRDVLYSLGVAYEGMAYEIINNNADETVKFSEDEAPQRSPKTLSNEDRIRVVKLFTQSVENYNSYLSHKPDASEKEEVIQRVEKLNAEIAKYNPEIVPSGNSEAKSAI